MGFQPSLEAIWGRSGRNQPSEAEVGCLGYVGVKQEQLPCGRGPPKHQDAKGAERMRGCCPGEYHQPASHMPFQCCTRKMTSAGHNSASPCLLWQHSHVREGSPEPGGLDTDNWKAFIHHYSLFFVDCCSTSLYLRIWPQLGHYLLRQMMTVTLLTAKYQLRVLKHYVCMCLD